MCNTGSDKEADGRPTIPDFVSGRTKSPMVDALLIKADLTSRRMNCQAASFQRVVLNTILSGVVAGRGREVTQFQ